MFLSNAFYTGFPVSLKLKCQHAPKCACAVRFGIFGKRVGWQGKNKIRRARKRKGEEI